MSEEKTVKALTYLPQRNHKFETDAAKGGKYPNMSEADWRQMVSDQMKAIYDSGQVEYLAYVFHDRDKVKDKDSGLILDAPLHCHVFVTFKQSIEQADVMAIFQASKESNCRKADNRLGAALYMIHMSVSAREEEKIEYRTDEVVSYGVRYRDLIKDSYWKKAENDDIKSKLVDKKDAEKLVNKLALRMSKGELRQDEAIDIMEAEAGYYWVRQYRQTFHADRLAYIERRIKDMTENGRANRNIYIMGAGGIGKSNLGRKYGVRLADGKGLYITAPLGVGKTPDALNHYTDEMVALYNEISPRGWSLDEFLACFDLYEYAPFPSRNENKHFIGHTSLFANSLSPLRFSKDLVIYSKGGSEYQDSANKREINPNSADGLDKYWQVRRRFNNFVVLLRDALDPNIVHGYVFNLRRGMILEDGSLNNNDGTHILVGNITFDCKPDEEPSITGVTLDELERLLAINTVGMFIGVKTIDEFLEDNGIVEASEDALMTDFIEEVVNNCVWDLLPTTFLYEIYRKFRDKYYPKDDLKSRPEFAYQLDAISDDWELKENPVSTNSRMDADEILIMEWDLKDWQNHDFTGGNISKKIDFKRKVSYRGFVRK